LNDTQTRALETFYEPSDVVLNPVTCYHVYSRAHELVARHATGLFTVLGPVFRHESHNHGPTRLAEFSMFELVSMGTTERVKADHDRFLASFESLLRKIGLPYRIVTAADAFYGNEPVFKRDAQMRGGGKYEARIPLPEGELSVGSINLHGNVFATAFDLATAQNDIKATCCAGIGIDRLVYAMNSYGVTLDKGKI
jgi:seryl-tRNA synthetase